MPTHVVSADTQAVLLLCGSLGRRSGSPAKPLSSIEYARLAGWLHQRGLRPADLLTGERSLDAADLPVAASRISALLERGAALALDLERWTHRGLWVISRGDDSYPRTLKARLGRLAPPLLYGAGDPALLSTGGVAIVGSRDADAGAERFATAVAEVCASQRITVVSGGARGVDTIAMSAAIACGGCAVGVLTESLDRAATSGRYREALRSGLLVLISPYDPGARFTVSAAMGRNKIVYALSCWSVVVSATARQGGTWAGAVENLRAGWVPLFVREGSDLPSGNHALRLEGGIPLLLPEVEAAPDLGELLTCKANGKAPAHDTREPDLFAAADPSAALPGVGEEAKSDPLIPENGTAVRDLFDLAWPHLQASLATPRSEDDIAGSLNLVPAQVRAWLVRAVDLGLVRRRVKPTRYELVDRFEGQLHLLESGETSSSAPPLRSPSGRRPKTRKTPPPETHP
ncbi:MAG TPA: DNA-processing protein DprA [Longimicrobiaceae bacterium]|nr:DNA-processing protein DprA [Longimicrobiaceae bacterium]